MKRLYTLMLIMLCTLSASAEWKIYFLSDSIFAPEHFKETTYTRPNGITVSMYGNERKMVDEDGLIELTGDFQFIQITDKPVALVYYNDETEEIQFLQAFGYYFDTEYDEETNYYNRTSDDYVGTYQPFYTKASNFNGSTLTQYLEFDKSSPYYNETGLSEWGLIHKRKHEHFEQNWYFLWWTYEQYTEQPYYYWKLEPGIYAVKAVNDKQGLGLVTEMYKIYYLEAIPDSQYPRFYVYSTKTETVSNVSVNVWYTYYTITGSDKKRTVATDVADYYMKGENVISAGEYAGCQYFKLPSTWKADYQVKIRYPADNTHFAEYCCVDAEDERPRMGVWYELKSNGTDDSKVSLTGWYKDYPGNVWAIWDVEGKRMKFLKEADFQKILSSATAIDNPIEVPYSPYYYSLDGQVVENPTPGKIYIHNGKKVVYKK